MKNSPINSIKKLKLSVEGLRVETFVTNSASSTSGTVLGHASNLYTDCTDTALTLCYCGGPSGYSCEGPSCDVVVDTCYDPCELSYMTNCHRCAYDSDHTRCINC